MQTRERTRKRHRNTTKSTVLYVSQHINTPKEPCTTVDTCCSPTSTRTINGNTSLALPKMLTQKQCARAQRTSSIHMADRRQGTQIVGVESAEKKRTHMKFALPTMCEHKTRPTWHMTPPQRNQLCFAVRRCTSQFSTKPHRLCLSNDNVSTRHGKSLPETQIMTGA